MSDYLELGNNQKIRFGDSLLLSPAISPSIEEIEQLIWENTGKDDCLNCASITIKPTQSTTITLTIVDKNGCIATDEIVVQVDRKQLYYIPTVFSPNSDGINDELQIYPSAGIKRIISFQIFDRWGNIVYSQKNYLPDTNNTWDGSFNGDKLQQGVYLYNLEVELINNSIEQFGGDITIIR